MNYRYLSARYLFKEDLIMTFIAGVHDYTVEQSHPYRQGITFEVVSFADLKPFLFQEHPLSPDDIPDGAFRRVYTSFLQNGIGSDAFRQIKFQYFGELQISYVEVYFDDLEYELFPMNSWYCIILDGSDPDPSIIPFLDADALFDYAKSYDCVFMVPQNPDDFSGYSMECTLHSCSVYLLTSDMQEALFQLSSLTEINAARDGIHGRISNITVFTRACVYDVGQALCVGLYSSTQNGQFSLCGFFDFGIPHTGRNPHPEYAAEYPRLCRQIAATTSQGGIIDIILSHWHPDHFALAMPLASCLGFTYWYVPNARVPAFMPQTMLNHIASNGGTLIFAPDPPAISVPYNGNPNLRVTKMDYRVSGRKQDHIHHHSLYAQLMLGSGTTVFLAGDCTYAGIDPNARTAGYDFLQASHHGGIYYKPPAVEDPDDIPWPKKPGESTVIYSCNRNHNRLGHPLPGIVEDHITAGWFNAYDTEVAGSVILY